MAMSITCQKESSGSSTMFGPGFRFHPTDEELVQYYLRRKVCGKAFRFDAISDVDVYKAEPWDLPYMSKQKTRDLEWYFFSLLDKKYGNGARTNRATEKGYWKTTGKDRAVYHKRQVVGMKKTLVYHCGRAPKGQRTNWVMHEYRLASSELETAGIAQDAFVVCRIFQKSGSGPKNGEQYGAPLVEEEWDNDELEFFHESDANEEVNFGDDLCFDGHDIQQILASDVQSVTAPIPMNFQCADGSHVEEIIDSSNGTPELLVSAGNQYCEPQLSDDKNIYNMPASYDMDAIPVIKENIGQCSKSWNSDDLDFLLNDPFLDSLDNLPNGEEGFIEANDLSNPFETDTTAFDMLEEYLTYFDANDDSSLCFSSDPSMMFGSDEDLAFGQTFLPLKETGEATEQAVLPGGQHIDNNNNAVVSPSDEPGSAKYQSDSQFRFVKKASQMLGNIPAPPAFAAEFPSKDAVVRLNSSMYSSGTIQSYRKHGTFNIVLSFGFSRGHDGSSSLESSVSIVPGKTASTISRGWFYVVFFWVLILSLSFRIGTYVCVK